MVAASSVLGSRRPALCQGNLLYIHKVAHAQTDLLGGVPPGGGGHGGGELRAGQPAPALCQGVQVRRHVRQLNQLQHIHQLLMNLLFIWGGT
jgi:hypothetical protein